MCGGARICWLSSTQKYVNLSISETDYVAIGEAVKKLFEEKYECI